MRWGRTGPRSLPCTRNPGRAQRSRRPRGPCRPRSCSRASPRARRRNPPSGRGLAANSSASRRLLHACLDRGGVQACSFALRRRLLRRLVAFIVTAGGEHRGQGEQENGGGNESSESWALRVSLLTAGHDARRVDSTMRRGLALVIATGAALLAIAPSAQADHHFVSIAEVFPGVSEQPTAEFVELQMYSAGQNNFAPGASLSFYNAAGTVTGTLPLADVTNGSNQRTALISTSAMETLSGKPADTEYGSAALDPAGGGCVCSQAFSPVRLIVWRGALPQSPAPGRPRVRSRTGPRSCAISALAATRCSRPVTTSTRASTTSHPAPSSRHSRMRRPDSTPAAPIPRSRRSRRRKPRTARQVRVLGRRRIPLHPRRVEGGGVRLWRIRARQAVEGKTSSPSARPRRRLHGRHPGDLHLEDRQEEVAGSRPAQASRIQPRWYGRSVGLSSIGPRRPLNAARPTDDVAVLA